MKKKAIAGIPYMTAGEADKKYKYVAMQRRQEVKGEDHLFVEIFENQPGERMPKLRMVFTKSDWCLYEPKEDVWPTGSFVDETGRNIWESHGEERDSETFMATADQDAVWSWCGGEKIGCSRKNKSWTERLEEHIEGIKNERRKKRRDNRAKRLRDREQNTTEPPSDLEEWADKNLFPDMHFIYYKRHGRYADVCCSQCGNVKTVAIKRRDTYEGMFERVMEPPKDGYTGRCPACGTIGTWKAQGKSRGVYGLSKSFFVGMPYKDSGAVIRYFICEKMIQLDEIAEENGLVMNGASEQNSIVEIARQYIEPGKKKIQKDFHKYDYYSRKEFWDDCGLYGFSNISIREGAIYEKTWEMLKGTILQYSGAEEYQRINREMNLMDYMERYVQYPQIEMFSKAGLVDVVKYMVDRQLEIVDPEAKRPEDFLGIHKERMKLLINKKGDVRYLEAMKTERRMKTHWTDEILQMVAETEATRGDLELATRYMGLKQLKNRIEKYAGCEIDENMCSHASRRIKDITRTYFDYLDMRQQRGYDLANKIYLWPRDLNAAHEQMINEINGERIKKRDMEAEERYPDIRKKYQSLRNQYFYEDAELLIRPARSAAEITREGRVLHHCVGGDSYLGKHNYGISTILFLRKKAEPEEPYITIEIKETRIIQWYGAYDRKDDKEYIDPWLKKYVTHLEGQRRIKVIA